MSTSPADESHPAVREAARLIAQAAPATGGADADRLAAAAADLETAIGLLRPSTAHDDAEAIRLLARACRLRGNAHRARGTPRSFEEALRSYDEAIETGRRLPASDEAAHDLADSWLNRGIALLLADGADHWRAAVAACDEAITLRRALPIRENAAFAYGLAGAWMNRADALTRLGSAEELREAVRSYDEALAVMRDLPIGEHAIVLLRVAVAWMNRGAVLQAQGEPETLREAVRSADEAASLLRPMSGSRPEFRARLAAALANRAHAQLQLGELAAARASAGEAINSVGDGGASAHPEFVETALAARLILYHSLARLIEQAPPTLDARQPLLDAAGEAIDEALQLGRRWTARGDARFRPVLRDLFEAGVRFYFATQPHFLAEFLLESLDPEHSADALPRWPELLETAARALRAALERCELPQFVDLDDPKIERQLALVRDLREALARFDELSGATGAA